MKKLLINLLLVGALFGSQQWTPPFGTPAYHKAPATGKLPPLVSFNELQKKGMTDYQVQAFKAADAHPSALYQLPCYCYCDRRHGHTSLHSCFETEHAAECKECMKEAIYADRMLKKHESLDEIRAGLARGDFRYVELGSTQSKNPQ